jgi:hypothetical protein
VVLESPPPAGFSPGADPEGRTPLVTLEMYQPLEVRVKVEMHGAQGFLVLTDTWYPGWNAWVDDVPTPILLADYAFRAVPLVQGVHSVTFRYQPLSHSLGGKFSLLSLILVLAWGGALWVMWVLRVR